MPVRYDIIASPSRHRTPGMAPNSQEPRGGGDWRRMVHCILILEPLDAHIHSYLGDWAAFDSSLSGLLKSGPDSQLKVQTRQTPVAILSV